MKRNEFPIPNYNISQKKLSRKKKKKKNPNNSTKKLSSTPLRQRTRPLQRKPPCFYAFHRRKIRFLGNRYLQAFHSPDTSPPLTPLQTHTKKHQPNTISAATKRANKHNKASLFGVSDSIFFWVTLLFLGCLRGPSAKGRNQI